MTTEFTLERYIAVLFTFFMWAALVVMNVGFALHQGTDFWKYVGCAFFGIFDLGAVFFMKLVFEEHRARRHGRAVAFASVWMTCCVVECFGSYSGMMEYTASMTAPVKKAEDERKGAEDDLRIEQANLADIRKSLNSEKNDSRRDDLHKRETASLARSTEIRKRTFSSSTPTVNNWLIGWEAPIVVSLWALCQICVYGLTGGVHGAESDANVMIRRRDMSPIHVNAWQQAQPMEPKQPTPATQVGALLFEPAQPKPMLIETTQEAHQSAQTTQAEINPIDQKTQPKPAQPSPEDNPDGTGGGGGNSAESVNKNSTQPNPTQPESGLTKPSKPKLSVVHGQPKPKGLGRPESGSFDGRVADMNRAGFSERAIAERLGVGRGKVRTVLNKIKDDATFGLSSGSSD